MPTTSELADLYAYPERERAWVRTNFVASIDGAAQGPDGLSGGLGGEADHRAFKVLRSLADIVIVGAGTARAENYRPIEPDSVHAELREGRPAAPTLALVSRNLDIPASLITPDLIVVTAESSPAKARARLAETAQVLVAGRDGVDWTAVLDVLARRNLRRVLCESGPSLHATLIGLDLVDEVCLTVSPHLIAGTAKRIATGGDSVARPMQLGHAIEDDGALLTRWVRDR